MITKLKPNCYPTPLKYQKQLKDFIAENLRHGFITESNSPIASPLFLFPKKNGDLRPVIDYRGLNNITIKQQYPIPNMGLLINQVAKAKIFSTFDMTNAYHLIRIASEEEWKTSFNTTDGQYEFRVLPFGLNNAPSAFQQFINSIFSDTIGVSVHIYLDVIIVFFNSHDEHTEHLTEVQKRLEDKFFECEPG